MTAGFTKLLMFLSSYFPLWIVVFLLYVEKHRWEAIATLTLGVISVLWLLHFMKAVQTRNGLPLKVAAAKRRDDEALSYIVSYLLPFLALPSEEWQKFIALAVFYVLLGVLFVKADLIHINPVLLLANYRIYEVQDSMGSTRTVISKSRLVHGSELFVIDIGDSLSIEKKI